MKTKIISIASAILLSTTLFVACNKNQISETTLITNTEVATPISSTSNCEITGITSSLFTSNNLEDNLKLLGELHNDCLEKYFTSVTQEGLKPNQQPNFDNHLRSTLKNYFEDKGVVLDNGNIYPCVYSGQTGLWDESDYQTNLSSNAQQIVNTVMHLFNDDAVSISALIDSLKALQSKAYLLNDNTEKIIVSSMIVVGINSMEYWEANAIEWRNYFGTDSNGNNPPQIISSSVLKKVGMSDAFGALRGGLGGLGIGGPAGAFGGALVGAGISSCMRAIVYGATGY